MDFPELRLVGYYTGKTQNMHEERARVTEAESLATLLAASLSTFNANSIENKKFTEDFYGNTVLIFEDHTRKLYSYYPRKGIARLSSVVFLRAGRRAPEEARAWFKPGEVWPIQHLQAENSTCPVLPQTEPKQKNLITKIKALFRNLFGKEH